MTRVSHETAASLSLFAALAFQFSGHLFRYQTLDSATHAVIALLGSLIYLVVPSVLCLRKTVRIAHLYYTMIALLLISLLIPEHAQGWLAIVRQLLNSSPSLSILIIWPLLSKRSERLVQTALFGAIAAGTGLTLLVNVLPLASFVNIGQMPTLLSLACITLSMALTDGSEDIPDGPAPRKETAQQLRGLFSQLLTQHGPASTTLALSPFLFFCFGMFEAVLLSQGTTLVERRSYLLAIVIVVATTLLISIISKNSAWFYRLWAAMPLVFILGFTSIVLDSQMAPIVFDILGTAIAVVHIPIWLFLSQEARNGRGNPILLFGLVTAVLFFSETAGRLLVLLCRDALHIPMDMGTSYAVASLAIIGCGLALFIYLPLRHSAASAGESQSTTAGGIAEPPLQAFEQICRERDLSERELEIIRLYALGRSVPYICSECSISESTAKTYIRRAYAKLGVGDKQQLLDLVYLDKLTDSGSGSSGL